MLDAVLHRLRRPGRSPGPAPRPPVALSGAPLRRAVCEAVEADVAHRLAGCPRDGRPRVERALQREAA